MHFAFAAEDEPDLSARKTDLENKGIKVTDVVDHGWCKSIYFRDPNNLRLEFCTVTGDLDESLLSDREAESWRRLSRET